MELFQGFTRIILVSELVPAQLIEDRILFIRGQRVMLDADLAELYEVPTKNLKRAVLRNRDQFPSDFLIELTAKEYAALRFQIGILKRGKHSKFLRG